MGGGVADVDAHLATIAVEHRRADAIDICALMRERSGSTAHTHLLSALSSHAAAPG